MNAPGKAIDAAEIDDDLYVVSADVAPASAVLNLLHETRAGARVGVRERAGGHRVQQLVVARHAKVPNDVRDTDGGERRHGECPEVEAVARRHIAAEFEIVERVARTRLGHRRLRSGDERVGAESYREWTVGHPR